ncbi:hypothetical protein P7266_1040 [Lactococcus cremoris]|nr:hypothetical protein P7266_1040 [Lactococcus cremoris]
MLTALSVFFYLLFKVFMTSKVGVTKRAENDMIVKAKIQRNKGVDDVKEERYRT